MLVRSEARKSKAVSAKASKAKLRCVIAIGMCLYAQLVQMKNKQEAVVIYLCLQLH